MVERSSDETVVRGSFSTSWKLTSAMRNDGVIAPVTPVTGVPGKERQDAVGPVADPRARPARPPGRRRRTGDALRARGRLRAPRGERPPAARDARRPGPRAPRGGAALRPGSAARAPGRRRGPRAR